MVKAMCRNFLLLVGVELLSTGKFLWHSLASVIDILLKVE